jgi:hypothetical protein
MDTVEIVPIAQDHIESFHRTLDVIARERRYLAFLEGPPTESTQAFILDKIERGVPQWIASSTGEVVGWRDLTPNGTPIYAHDSVLGMGLLPQFRGRELARI